MRASTIAPRNWLRACSPRSATRSETSRIASERSRSRRLGSPRAAAAGGRAEQGREHRPPRRRVGRHAVHHGPREQRAGSSSRRRGGPRPPPPAGRPGCARRRRRVRRAGRRRSASGRLAERGQRDLGQRREPVDRLVRVGDRRGLRGERRRSPARLRPVPARGPGPSDARRSRARQTVPRSATYWYSSAMGSAVSDSASKRGERAVHEIGDDGRHGRQRTSGGLGPRGHRGRRRDVLRGEHRRAPRG